MCTTFLSPYGLLNGKWENGNHGKASGRWKYFKNYYRWSSPCENLTNIRKAMTNVENSSNCNLRRGILGATSGGDHKRPWLLQNLQILHVQHQKLAAQSIYSELREADEANLLDEDDMLVFSLKPMADPLDLVCCNACKKPVIVSQFAAHAELCKSLSSAEEIVLKLNCGSKHKKPPRKERKKSSNVYAEPTLDEQMHLTSSSPVEAKGNSLSADELLMMGGSGISPGHANNSARSLAPRTKRSKLISADSLLKSDHLETASGVTKSFFINTQEAITCGDLNGLKTGSTTTSDHVGYQLPRQVSDCYMLTKEVPAPLATKIYYSQRDHRLRSAINSLFNASTS